MSLKTLLSIAAFIVIPALAKAEYYQFELKFDYSPNTEARKSLKPADLPTTVTKTVEDPNDPERPEYTKNPPKTLEEAIKYAENRLQVGWPHPVETRKCGDREQKGDDVSVCPVVMHRENSRVVGVIIFQGKKKPNKKKAIDWRENCFIGDVQEMPVEKFKDIDEKKMKPKKRQKENECRLVGSPAGGTTGDGKTATHSK